MASWGIEEERSLRMTASGPESIGASRRRLKAVRVGRGARAGARGGDGRRPARRGLRFLAGLAAVVMVGTILPPAGAVARASGLLPVAGSSQVAGGQAVEVLAAEGLVPLPGGGWELQDRTGRLRLRLPRGAGALSLTLPEGGPVLLTPPGDTVRVVAATASGLVHEIVPAGGPGSAVELEFHAVPEQTVRTRIGAITALPAEGGVTATSRPGATAARGDASGDYRTQAEDGSGTPGEPGEDGNTSSPDPALAWVRFFGGGYGHRAGLSQYGARGLTKLGVGYQDILRHYFPGTRVEKKVSDTGQTVRVGLSLDENGTGSSAPVPRLLWMMNVPAGTKVQQGSATRDLPAGTYKLTYKAGTGFRFEPQNGTPGQPLDLGGTKVEVVAPAGGVLTLHYPYVNCDPKLNHAYQGCRRYEGRLEFEGLPDGRIIARNKINLRQYLTGVVPHEMPASWETEALKAQAVVARTYAARQNYGLDQNLVDSTYDQVFYGRYEDGTSDGRYEQKIDSIVKATDGQLLYYQAQLATGNFGSANGGWIASNTEAFGDGTGTPLPYMTGREDRYRLPDGTTVTPESYWRGNQKYEATYFRWEREFATSVIESKWPQVGQLQSIEVVKRSNTWTALQIRITGSAGSVVVSGRQFRSVLNLPSTMLLPDKLYPRAFYDVQTGPLAGEINRAYQLNLVSGDIYARFHPGDPLTRSAFVKMLVNAVEASTGTQLPGPDTDPGTEDEPFSDVNPDQALYEYVVKAYKAGYVQGYDKHTFGYDRPIKRQEAAAIIARALELPAAKENFEDVPDDSHFAGAIGAVAAAGIMRGYDDKRFGPGATMTRGEAAAAAALRTYDYCQAKGCSR